MRSSASKIQMTGFDDLFQTEPKAEVSGERVQEIPLADLHPFKNHPFQVRDDEAMQETADSIAKYGVLVPGIARPRPEGGYEIVAGHRRKRGSELAGKETMPVFIRELDDDEAILIMIDSNLQREKILPSEKAFAYKMKLEAIKHQGKRNDLTLVRGVPKLPARERIAQDAGEKSGVAVTRYIMLTKLVPALLSLVDEDKVSVSSAADYLSDLLESEQNDLVSAMNKLNIIPSKGQFAKIKKHSKEGTLTTAMIEEILAEERSVPMQVTLKRDRLKQYFPESYTSQQMEEVIISLLESWHIQQQ